VLLPAIFPALHLPRTDYNDLRGLKPGDLATHRPHDHFVYFHRPTFTTLRAPKMQMSKTTYLVFVIVVTIMTLSVTVFRDGKGSAALRQDVRRTAVPIYERDERHQVVDFNEPEPADLVKKAKLKKQQQRYDKDAPFSHPGPNDVEVAFLPEMQFDFPAL
jgi:hypothetical protein